LRVKVEAEGGGDKLTQKIRLVEAAPILTKRMKGNKDKAKLVVLPKRQ